MQNGWKLQKAYKPTTVVVGASRHQNIKPALLPPHRKACTALSGAKWYCVQPHRARALPLLPTFLPFLRYHNPASALKILQLAYAAVMLRSRSFDCLTIIDTLTCKNVRKKQTQNQQQILNKCGSRISTSECYGGDFSSLHHTGTCTSFMGASFYCIKKFPPKLARVCLCSSGRNPENHEVAASGLLEMVPSHKWLALECDLGGQRRHSTWLDCKILLKLHRSFWESCVRSCSQLENFEHVYTSTIFQKKKNTHTHNIAKVPRLVEEGRQKPLHLSGCGCSWWLAICKRTPQVRL